MWVAGGRRQAEVALPSTTNHHPNNQATKQPGNQQPATNWYNTPMLPQPPYPPPDEIQAALHGLPLGAWVYFPQTGSTNAYALAWAEAGAPDGCLVLADEQTQGRGRLGRRWYTPPGAALAFTLVLRPLPPEQPHLSRWAVWGGLAVTLALERTLGLRPRLKWPNDVLLSGRKVAGVLAETLWQGDRPQAVALGIGVNITPQAVPPAASVDFPAGCVAEATDAPVNRWALLRAILQDLLAWRTRVPTPAFLAAWEARLAYRGERVTATLPDGATLRGTVLGLTPQGGLRLQTPQGERIIPASVAHLRPEKGEPD